MVLGIILGTVGRQEAPSKGRSWALRRPGQEAIPNYKEWSAEDFFMYQSQILFEIDVLAEVRDASD